MLLDFRYCNCKISYKIRRIRFLYRMITSPLTPLQPLLLLYSFERITEHTIIRSYTLRYFLRSTSFLSPVLRLNRLSHDSWTPRRLGARVCQITLPCLVSALLSTNRAFWSSSLLIVSSNDMLTLSFRSKRCFYRSFCKKEFRTSVTSWAYSI